MGFDACDQVFEFLAMLFQKFESTAKLLDRGILWIYPVDDIVHNAAIVTIAGSVAGHEPQHPIVVVDPLTVASDDSTGDADYGAVRGDIFVNDGVRTDLAVRPDRDGAKNFGTHTNEYAIFQGRVTLDLVQARTAEGDLMIQEHIIPDDGGLAYHDAHAMVDEKATPDLGTGVNLYAGDEPAELRHKTRKKLEVPAPQSMGEPVEPERMQARIGEHFQEVAGCRVFRKYCLNIFFDTSEHGNTRSLLLSVVSFLFAILSTSCLLLCKRRRPIQGSWNGLIQIAGSDGRNVTSCFCLAFVALIVLTGVTLISLKV